MSFPEERPRRLRRTERLRAMVRETRVTPENLVYPLFVTPGTGVRKEISSLPGCFHLSVDEAAREAEEVERLGIGGVILFGLPAEQGPVGSEGYADDGVVQEATRAIRAACPELLVITDVCLCEYTAHGHCGVIEDGEVNNDPTLELLAREAVSHAQAGADVVAPSDMMDGRVGAIRDALDDGRLRRGADPLLRRQVRLGLLRSLPRGRRLRAPVRRPARATRWTRPTCARRCARCGSTSRRARTW